MNAAMRVLAPTVKSRVVPHVYVLGSDSIGAFAWPDGSLYVHHRLVDALDDQELAAVLAHELGHLMNASLILAPATLHGCDASIEDEVHADARGVDTLKAAGLDPAAMRSMLTKVDHLLTDAPPMCHIAMCRRIALLPLRQKS
jgi:predicted Zn-dependent protease